MRPSNISPDERGNMHKDNAVLRQLNAVGSNACRSAAIAAMVLALAPATALAANATTETGSEATNNAPISATSEGQESSTDNSNATSANEAAAQSASTYDLSKIADGTYTGTCTIPDNEDDEWTGYTVTVDVTVADHKITKVDVSRNEPSQSTDYVSKSLNGKKSNGYVGTPAQIVSANGTTVDGVSGATFTSDAIKSATDSALQAAYDEQTSKPAEPEYTYGYASLTWAEYWANEGVYNAGDASSSDEVDRDAGNGVTEHDRGGYDVVTRATSNHGLHRGSFQSVDVIETAEGVELNPSYYPDKTHFVDTANTTWTINGKTVTDGTNTYTITGHKVTGTKYVPVKVKTSDLDAFKKTHSFVANGETLQGGFSEGTLKSYTGVVANVDDTTNGLKEVTNDNGTFTFSAAKTGTGSGIEGQSLKQATNVEPTVRRTAKADTANEDTFHTGSFGEFLRVDINGNGYSDLGANMQSVTWTYYGDDSTYVDAKMTYGTKFAADNWMHKSFGIQLGLTSSARCQLPEGTDGTGYWKVTVHALGYEDYSYTFEATADNIYTEPEYVTDATKKSLEDLVAKAKALNKASYTSDSWSASGIETELSEAEGLLAKSELEESEAAEQVEHLTNAIDALVKAHPVAGDYILVNIPYADFYAAETGSNATSVDVFTSATKNKTANANLAGGSYHKADGSEITGITFPVKVTTEAETSLDWSKFTQVDSQDTLATSDSYAFTYLTEAPASYKELGVSDSSAAFSATKGAQAVQIDGSAEADFSTESTYGDYELDFGTDSTVFAALKDATVYGAVLNTTDGAGYGMRHLENMWKTAKHGFELAWCTGFTEEVHGCPTSSAHYESIMGKKLQSLTVYSSAGTYTISLGDIYVPVKTADASIAAEDVDLDDEDAVVNATVELPEGFDASYSIDGTDVTALLTRSNMTFDASSLTPGNHTLKATDKNGTYAAVSTSFTASTAKTPATYDDTTKKLVAAEGASDSDLTRYLGNIASVSVNGIAYSATGRGSTQVVKDGAIDLTATSGQGDSAKKVFDGYGTYTVKVSATGYSTDLEFTLTYEADKTALNEAIESAEKVNESSYTASSCVAFENALAAARKVAANVEATDDEVAQAAEALTSAQNALVKAATDDDSAALADEIAKADELNETDYTTDSWKAYQAALVAAQKVADKKDASADEVQKATSALAAAREALAKPQADTANEPAGDAAQSTTTATSSTSTATSDAKKTSVADMPATGDNAGMAAAVAALGAAVVAAGAALRRRFNA